MTSIFLLSSLQFVLFANQIVENEIASQFDCTTRRMGWFYADLPAVIK